MISRAIQTQMSVYAASGAGPAYQTVYANTRIAQELPNFCATRALTPAGSQRLVLNFASLVIKAACGVLY